VPRPALEGAFVTTARTPRPRRAEDIASTHEECAELAERRTDGGERYADLVRAQLRLLGEDPDREGLRKTPERVAEAMRWMTRGYETCVEDVVNGAVFEEDHESMILVRDIEIYSMCEHHMLPFFGRAHVAYIPNGKIIGLSKVARLVDVFARRLQVQERLTDQIADAIMGVLAPHGVGVVVEAWHLCMMMRGVEKQNSKTVTSSVRGTFRSDSKTRQEFLLLVHGGQRGLE
jgi:GTP cyclohydrolase I